MNNLLEEREERYRRRKQDKKRHDLEIDLAHKAERKTLSLTHPLKSLSDNRQRLLDEGAVEADGWIDCFIKRGTIEKFLTGQNLYLDNIDEDYVGTVNLGHMGFSEFPYIIGSWTLKDLHMVDLENSRKAVDVDIHLDEESIFVQELARKNYDIGISAEFYYHVDEEATEDLADTRGEYIPVIDEILIKAYALVGECGNVNSDGLELKGGKTVEDKITLNIELEGVDEVKEKIEELTETIEEATVEEPTEEQVAEESEEDEAEEEQTEEPVEEEIAEEVQEDEEDEDEEDSALDELSVMLDELTSENKDLKATIKVLKQKNKKLRNKLDAKEEAIEEFANKFKGLSLTLGLKKEDEEKEVKPEQTRVYAGNDGIGE